MDREQALPSDCADHRVHLDNRCIRILLHKCFEFLVGPADAAAFIDFEFRLLTAGAEPDLPWKVDVADLQETVVNVVVDGLLTAHQLVLMSDIDLMNRVTLLNKWRNDTVQPCDLLLTG